jgi:hypothetical protein
LDFEVLLTSEPLVVFTCRKRKLANKKRESKREDQRLPLGGVISKLSLLFRNFVVNCKVPACDTVTVKRKRWFWFGSVELRGYFTCTTGKAHICTE